MKQAFVLFLFIVFSATAISQQVPAGMKYQAVARDTKGAVLAEQQIVLKVTLSGIAGQNWKNYYSETHDAITNQLGLFTLTIGEGKAPLGKFTDVPWSSSEVWMEVSIRDNSGFVTLSNSKLLAVPYAFHALTANKLAGSIDAGRTGIPSNTWSTFGNSKTNPATDALGTTDAADLLIITNDVERIRVLQNGDVDIKRNVAIGSNLKVDGGVVLNEMNGATINKGAFTVDRQSPTLLTGNLTVSNNRPTLLSGNLTVDLATDLNTTLNVDGPTNLNSTLTVNNAMDTKLSGALQVDGVTTLKGSFFVNEAKPSVLTGPLRLDLDGTFKKALILDNKELEQDTASLVPSGALRVAGGGGFGGNLTIGGSAKIGKGLQLGNLNVTDPTPSSDTKSGALRVTGGVGIGMQLNVGGKTVINNNLEVNAGTGQVVINGGGTGSEGNTTTSPLVINGKTQGVEVKLTGVNAPGRANNYITFKDKNNVVRGRIEGETEADLDSDPWYKWDIIDYSKTVTKSTVAVAFAAKELVAASSDARACVGLGVVVCPPSFGTIVVRVLKLAASIAELAVDVKSLVDYTKQKKDYIGVLYSSGAGDYAEWLPKENVATAFKPGQVIGVKKGKISLNTEGAERVLVISTNPIVLGNTPDAGTTGNFEKAAFLGQVPVRVRGRVEEGDFVLASNHHDGVAIAKKPENVTSDDLANFVGVAWTGSDILEEKAVRVAVGISSSDIKLMVQKMDEKLAAQARELNDLKGQMNSNNAMLAKLVPGFKPVAIPMPAVQSERTRLADQPEGLTKEAAIPVAEYTVEKPGAPVLKFNPGNYQQIQDEIFAYFNHRMSNTEDKRLPEMDDEMIGKMLEWGTKYSEGNITDAATRKQVSAKLFSALQSDASFKTTLFNNIKESYRQGIEESKMLTRQ